MWLLVPLVALWSNLHGGVLLGVAVAGAYLLFARARQDWRTAVAVLAGMVLALFATPALTETANYYGGVIGSQAATHGEGLWEPLSFRAPFDLIFLAVAIPLIALALRSRPALWEVVVWPGSALRPSGRVGTRSGWRCSSPYRPQALAGSRSWRLTAPRNAASAVTGLLVLVAIAGLVRTPKPAGATGRVLNGPRSSRSRDTDPGRRRRCRAVGARRAIES